MTDMYRLGTSLVALVIAASAAPLLYDSSADSTWKSWTAIHGVAQADNAVKRMGRASLRIDASGDSDALIRSGALTLRPGKHYELSAWVRTEGLEIADGGRSPIAVGATLTMGSMPFDVHAESLAGTRDWTRLKLRFTATRSSDAVMLRVAEGGRFRGRAWFDGVTVEEVAPGAGLPDRASLATFGPAYRYPTAGWIYLHVEGKPYERGYQHGHLMPKEIERYLERCASLLDSRSREHAWDNGRVTADALFLRGFDDEIREEMKGIADGAAAAGAKWHGRPVDLLDIVTANVIVELGDLQSALRITKTGLEGLGFAPPSYAGDVAPNERCSAFAATGKATRDGRMIVAHTTFWPLTLSEQTNVMLDILPEQGRRLLMQSYPGGIESGTDWYQNDAGVVLTETTIRQSPFHRDGTPVAFRARKAIQYGTNVDEVVKLLKTSNNGLYTNEWIIGDAKNDEIAMFELGTYKTKLWRSSKNEWFGGTEGFYWGCNNAKDFDVRLEYLPDPKGRPEDITFRPSNRDLKWRQMYRQHKGSIDEQFAFLAFRTSPLVSASAMDAKVATGEMASNLMLWAAIGKPNQRERLAARWDDNGLNEGLYPSGYRLFAAAAPEPLAKMIADVEHERRTSGGVQPVKPEVKSSTILAKSKLWKGWILPASDADLWLTSGAAAYYLRLNGDDPVKAMDRVRVMARAAANQADTPLSRIRLDLDDAQPNRLASSKGALLLHALRREIGDEKFAELMRSFYDAHTTRAVSTADFRAAADRAAGKPLGAFFDRWLNEPGIPGDSGGAATLVSDVEDRFSSLLIIYGTMADAGSNRYAAEQIIHHDWFEHSPVIKKDFELTAEDLRDHDVVFIGRPESNQALASIVTDIGLDYTGAAFTVDGRKHASEYDALAFSARNPANPKKTIVVLAGNSALETVKLAKADLEDAPFAVYHSGKRQ